MLASNYDWFIAGVALFSSRPTTLSTQPLALELHRLLATDRHPFDRPRTPAYKRQPHGEGRAEKARAGVPSVVRPKAVGRIPQVMNGEPYGKNRLAYSPFIRHHYGKKKDTARDQKIGEFRRI